jgi:hypothetical protein
MDQALHRHHRCIDGDPAHWLPAGREMAARVKEAIGLLIAVMVQREMEKPGLGDKVECTWEQMGSICRFGANPERERQGGIVPPPFGLGPWVGARVVSPRSPILRPGRRSS